MSFPEIQESDPDFGENSPNSRGYPYEIRRQGRNSRTRIPIPDSSKDNQNELFPDYLEAVINALSGFPSRCTEAVQEVRDMLDEKTVFPAQSPHAANFVMLCAIAYQLNEHAERMDDIRSALRDIAKGGGANGISRDDFHKQTENITQIVSALMEMSRSLSTIVEEQSGETLSPEVFRESLEKNFDALSRKVDASLRNGRLIIPTALLAACLGGGIGIGFILTKFIF